VWVITISNCSPAFEPIQGNEQFQKVSKTANDQIIAVNEASGQEIIRPPQEQKGVLRLGISPTPSITPSSSATPSSSITPSPSITPSSSVTPSSSITPSPSVVASSPASVSSPVSSPEPTQSSFENIECLRVYEHIHPVESGPPSPEELTNGMPSLPHFGKEGSTCIYYVNVPKDAKTYTATLSAVGSPTLSVAFEGYPYGSFSDGVDAECIFMHSESQEKCEGDLKGNEKIYLKLESEWESFSNGILEVSFDVLTPTPSPSPGAIICPQLYSSDEYQPVELPANTPVGNHNGIDGSICYYYVNVPENSKTYTATLTANGEAKLYIGFEDYPWSTFTGGSLVECTVSSFWQNKCEGGLKGNDKIYLKLEGYGRVSNGTIVGFSNGILDVSFDIIPPTPSPAPGAINCPGAQKLNPTLPRPSEYEAVELPANTPVGNHYGIEFSVCSYYVKVPENAVKYEATVNVPGVQILVAFEGEPLGFTNGNDRVCMSEPEGQQVAHCEGDLVGNENVFLKIQSYDEFSNLTLAVNFDVPPGRRDVQ